MVNCCLLDQPIFASESGQLPSFVGWVAVVFEYAVFVPYLMARSFVSTRPTLHHSSEVMQGSLNTFR
jgi:hypothetical protein